LKAEAAMKRFQISVSGLKRTKQGQALEYLFAEK